MAVNPQILRSLLGMAVSPVTTGETTMSASDTNLAQAQLQNAMEIEQRDAANRRANRDSLLGGHKLALAQTNEAAGNANILRALQFKDPAALELGLAMRDDAQRVSADLSPTYSDFEDAARAGRGALIDTAASTAGQGLTSMGPSIAAGLAAGVLTRGGSLLLPGIAGAAASYPMNRDESINTIMSDPAALKAAIADPNQASSNIHKAALLNSSIDFIPGMIGTTVAKNMAARAAKGLLKRTAADVAGKEAALPLSARVLANPLVQGVGEGLQEDAQGLVNKAASLDLQGRDLNTDNLIDRKDLVNDFLGGLLTTGAAHTIGATASAGTGALADQLGRAAAPVINAGQRGLDAARPVANNVFNAGKAKVTDFLKEGGTGEKLTELMKNAAGAGLAVSGVAAQEARDYMGERFGVNLDLDNMNAVLSDFSKVETARDIETAFRKHYPNDEAENRGLAILDAWTAAAPSDMQRAVLQAARGDKKQMVLFGTYAKRAELLHFLALQEGTVDPRDIQLAEGVLTGTIPLFDESAEAAKNRAEFDRRFTAAGLTAGRLIAKGAWNKTADFLAEETAAVTEALGTAAKKIGGRGAEALGEVAQRGAFRHTNIQAVTEPTLAAAKAVFTRHMPKNTPQSTLDVVHEAIPTLMAAAMRSESNGTQGLRAADYQEILSRISKDPSALAKDLHALAAGGQTKSQRRTFENIKSATEDVAAGGKPYLKTLVLPVTANNPKRLAEAAGALDAVIAGRVKLKDTALASHFLNKAAVGMALRYYTPKNASGEDSVATKVEAARAKAIHKQTQLEQKIKAAMNAKNVVDFGGTREGESTDEGDGVERPNQNKAPGRRYDPHFVRRAPAYSVHVVDAKGEVQRDAVTELFSAERADRQKQGKKSGSSVSDLLMVPGGEFAADLEANHQSVRHYLNGLQRALQKLLDEQAGRSAYIRSRAIYEAGNAFAGHLPKTWFTKGTGANELDAGYKEVRSYKYALSSALRVTQLLADDAVNTIPPSVVTERLRAALTSKATAAAFGEVPTDTAVYATALVDFALQHKSAEQIIASVMKGLAGAADIAYGSTEYKAALAEPPKHDVLVKDTGTIAYTRAVIDRLNAVNTALYKLDAGRADPLKGLAFSIKETSMDAFPTQPERTVADDGMIAKWTHTGGHLDASTVKITYDNGKELNLSSNRMAGTHTYVESLDKSLDKNHAKFLEALARLVARGDIASIDFVPDFGVNYLQHAVHGAIDAETRPQRLAELEAAKARAKMKGAVAPVRIYDAAAGKLDTSDIPPDAWVSSPLRGAPGAEHAKTATIPGSSYTIVGPKADTPARAAERSAQRQKASAQGRKKREDAAAAATEVAKEKNRQSQVRYRAHRAFIIRTQDVKAANAMDKELRAEYFGTPWRSEGRAALEDLARMYPSVDDRDAATEAEGEAGYGKTDIARLSDRLVVLEERRADVEEELSDMSVGADVEEDLAAWRQDPSSDTALMIKRDLLKALRDTATDARDFTVGERVAIAFTFADKQRKAEWAEQGVHTAADALSGDHGKFTAVAKFTPVVRGFVYANATLEDQIAETTARLEGTASTEASSREDHVRTFNSNPSPSDERHMSAEIAAEGRQPNLLGRDSEEREAFAERRAANTRAKLTTPEPSRYLERVDSAPLDIEPAIYAITGDNKRRTRWADIVSIGRLFPPRYAPLAHPALNKLTGTNLSKFLQGKMSTTALLETVGLSYAELRNTAPKTLQAVLDADKNGVWTRAAEIYGEKRAVDMYTKALPSLLHEQASALLANAFVDELARAVQQAVPQFKGDREASAEQNRAAFSEAVMAASPTLARSTHLRSLFEESMLESSELQNAVKRVHDTKRLRAALRAVVNRLPEKGVTLASTSSNLAVQLRRMMESGDADTVKAILSSAHISRRIKLSARIPETAQLLREDKAYRKYTRAYDSAAHIDNVMRTNNADKIPEVQALIAEIKGRQPAIALVGAAAERDANDPASALADVMRAARQRANYRERSSGSHQKIVTPSRLPASPKERAAQKLRAERSAAERERLKAEERRQLRRERLLAERAAKAQAREDARTGPTKKFNKQAGVGEQAGVTEAELQQIITVRLGRQVKTAYRRLHSELGGNSGTFTFTEATGTRLIDIAVNATNPLQIMAHESLHALLSLLKKTPDVRRTIGQLERVAQEPEIRRFMLTKLVEHEVAAGADEKTAARKFNAELNDNEEAVAYMFQFWEHDPEMRALLKGGSSGILSSIAKFLRGLFGLVSESEKVDKIFEAFVEGKLASASKRDARFATVGGATFGDKRHKLLGPLEDAFHRYYTPGLNNMRDSNVPALKALSERMYIPIGEEQARANFIDARRAAIGMFAGRMASLAGAYSETELQDAVRTLQARDKPETEAEKALADYLKDIQFFATGLKTDMHDIIPGMPFMWDEKRVKDGQAELVNILQTEAGMDEESAAEFAAEILAMGSTTGIANNAYLPGFAKNTPSYIATLKELAKNPAATQALAQFQVLDLHLALEQYTKDLAQRAVFTHFFGPDGGLIKQSLALAKKQGATDAEVKAARDSVENALGVYKADTVTQSMRELMGWTATGLHVILLPFGLVSQMIDPFALAARSGDAHDIWRGYWKPLQRLFRWTKGLAGFENEEDYHEEMSKTLGLMAEDMSEALMGHVTTGASAFIRKVNAVYFKANGMAGWNDSQRIVALAAAERYILSAKENGDSAKLAELGLTAAAVHVDEKGRLIYQGPRNMTVQMALRRFIESAVVRADNVHQANWMSDPRFTLVAQMKRFTYAFSHTVLQRAYKRWDKFDEMAPMAYLAGAMPMIMALDAAKWAMFGGPNTATWTMMDYMTHMLSRAGLLGHGSAYVSPSHLGLMPRFDFGPTIEMVAKVGKNGFGEIPGMALIGRRANAQAVPPNRGKNVLRRMP